MIFLDCVQIIAVCVVHTAHRAAWPIVRTLVSGQADFIVLANHWHLRSRLLRSDYSEVCTQRGVGFRDSNTSGSVLPTTSRGRERIPANDKEGVHLDSSLSTRLTMNIIEVALLGQHLVGANDSIVILRTSLTRRLIDGRRTSVLPPMTSDAVSCLHPQPS